MKPEQIEQLERLRKSLCRETASDWIEDTSHENGNYMNICVLCKCEFVGHKRRVVCKTCDKKGKKYDYV